jgi:hypothetical protein
LGYRIIYTGGIGWVVSTWLCWIGAAVADMISGVLGGSFFGNGGNMYDSIVVVGS